MTPATHFRPRGRGACGGAGRPIPAAAVATWNTEIHAVSADHRPTIEEAVSWEPPADPPDQHARGPDFTRKITQHPPPVPVVGWRLAGVTAVAPLPSRCRATAAMAPGRTLAWPAHGSAGEDLLKTIGRRPPRRGALMRPDGVEGRLTMRPKTSPRPPRRRCRQSRSRSWPATSWISPPDGRRSNGRLPTIVLRRRVLRTVTHSPLQRFRVIANLGGRSLMLLFRLRGSELAYPPGHILSWPRLSSSDELGTGPPRPFLEASPGHGRLGGAV
jgi:hypothetical protein